MGASEELSKFAAGLTYETLPGEAPELLKNWLLDTIGCIAGGTKQPSNQILLNTFQPLAGAGPSTVMFQTFQADCASAAMLNGAIGHTIELDDDHREGTIHTAVVVIPSALAVGEYVGASGKDILTAMAVGYEVGVRIGEAFLGNLFYQGFHPTGVCGVFSSAATAGRLLGLNSDQMQHALGIAGTQASGNREWKASGAWTKRLQVGHANAAGVHAAFLAKNGFTGPREFLEGQYGLLNCYSYQGSYDSGRITNGLGGEYDFLKNSLKPHASCRFAQPIIDSTLALVTRYDIQPEDIKRIVVGMGKNALIALTEPRERKYRPKNRVDAQFSLPYAAAVSVVRRKAFINEFAPEAFTDPHICAVADKVEYFLDPKVEQLWPHCYAASVRIETVAGQTYFHQTDYPKGDPENPMSRGEILNKFLYLMNGAGYGEQANDVANIVGQMETLEKICNLMKLLSRSGK